MNSKLQKQMSKTNLLNDNKKIENQNVTNKNK